jgi:hypothetical protein
MLIAIASRRDHNERHRCHAEKSFTQTTPECETVAVGYEGVAHGSKR